MEVNGRSRTLTFEVVGWLTIASYFLLFVLCITPFYNRLYRVVVNLLHLTVFFVSISAIVLGLVPYYVYKKRFGRALLCVGLGLHTFFTVQHVHNWRVGLTERLIRTRYCQEGSPVEADTILGGIENTGGMYINDSHCLIVVCSEEFYYCSAE